MGGILRIPQKLPQNTQDWEQFTRRLNESIRDEGSRIVLSTLTTIAERSGTSLDTLLTYIGDTGRATDQRLLPMVNFGNVSSVQSVDPLSATAGPSTADIAISAHTLHTDFGNIAYNSGAITGLALNTRYYVYADDPTNAGGAVTYVSSTSKPNVPANSGRYLVGSIVTPVSASTSSIIAASSTNPIIFQTSAAHGWTTGNTGQPAALPGSFSALNGNQYTMTVIDSDEFSIAVDGSAFAAYTSGGTVTRVVPDEFPDYGGGGGGALP